MKFCYRSWINAGCRYTEEPARAGKPQIAKVTVWPERPRACLQPSLEAKQSVAYSLTVSKCQETGCALAIQSSLASTLLMGSQLCLLNNCTGNSQTNPLGSSPAAVQLQVCRCQKLCAFSHAYKFIWWGEAGVRQKGRQA